MTKIDHKRDELRLTDDARKRQKQRAAYKKQENPRQEMVGFLDDQDAMGSALSELHGQRLELVAELFKAFEHAFVHNDLSVYRKFVSALTDANERSICLRILNGTLLSHGFVIREGQIEFEKRAKLEWREIGVHALSYNLRSFFISGKKSFIFNNRFEEKLSDL